MSDATLKHIYTGKVRELYEITHDRMLMVASDRVSVFDVVLPDEIPDKGRVLTGLSSWWFEQTATLVPNHVISADPTDFPEITRDIEGRAMLVRSARPVRLECVVRGYAFGHGWSEYVKSGTIGGHPAPAGLREAEKLPEPLFTPSTKAETGHDEALTPDEAIALVGAEQYGKLREMSLLLYEFGARHADKCGVILADTKFEFGELESGETILIDEVMTPDSSRYWPKDRYVVGGSPPSFDKQFVRDYMDEIGWDRESPPPHLPTEVIDNTRARYIEAYELITEQSFDEWFGPES